MGMEMGFGEWEELYLDTTSIERFHRNLSILRKTAGLSCKDMSDILGITRATYSAIESVGEMPRLYYLAIHDALIRLANANKDIVNVLRELIDIIDMGELSESDEQRLQDIVAAVEKRTPRKLGSKTLGSRIRIELYSWIVHRNSIILLNERS